MRALGGDNACPAGGGAGRYTDVCSFVSPYKADEKTNTFHDRREANNGAGNGSDRLWYSEGSVRGVLWCCIAVIHTVSVAREWVAAPLNGWSACEIWS